MPDLKEEEKIPYQGSAQRLVQLDGSSTVSLFNHGHSTSRLAFNYQRQRGLTLNVISYL